jgi:hypothetical protein
MKNFEYEHKLARNIVPYRNFDCDLQQAIMQTEFSIVLETYFDLNTSITFSEKIFRCLKLPRPWLMFAMANAVSYLRDMGVDVLDDIVDHSYDRVENAIERQSVLLDQIESMCKCTLTDKQIARCEQAANHNQSLLDKMFGTWYQDVENSLVRAVEKCKRL